MKSSSRAYSLAREAYTVWDEKTPAGRGGKAAQGPIGLKTGHGTTSNKWCRNIDI
jgi:hypothetical protein